MAAMLPFIPRHKRMFDTRTTIYVGVGRRKRSHAHARLLVNQYLKTQLRMESEAQSW